MFEIWECHVWIFLEHLLDIKHIFNVNYYVKSIKNYFLYEVLDQNSHIIINLYLYSTEIDEIVSSGGKNQKKVAIPEEMDKILQSLYEWVGSNSDVPDHIKAILKKADGYNARAALPGTGIHDDSTSTLWSHN